MNPPRRRFFQKAEIDNGWPIVKAAGIKAE
jgi:hypothetical protein